MRNQLPCIIKCFSYTLQSISTFYALNFLKNSMICLPLDEVKYIPIYTQYNCLCKILTSDLCRAEQCHQFARCVEGQCRCLDGYEGDGYQMCNIIPGGKYNLVYLSVKSLVMAH